MNGGQLPPFVVWVDERKRAYACMRDGPVNGGDLTPVFMVARTLGIVDTRHKLIVYGTSCLVADDGPGSAWRFEQCELTKLRELWAEHAYGGSQ